MLKAKEIFEAFWWKNWMVFLSFFLLPWEVLRITQHLGSPSGLNVKRSRLETFRPWFIWLFFFLPRKWFSFCSFFELCLETVAHRREAEVVLRLLRTFKLNQRDLLHF